MDSSAPVAISYTPDAVLAMDDVTLIAEFSRLTGCVALSCKHCHKTSIPLEKFTLGIRAAAVKKTGLNATMNLPKTCNAQKKASAIRNPISNKFYYRIKNAKTLEEELELKAMMKTALQAV